MSTRGPAGIVYKNNVYSVYNHCDSDPGCLGDEVVNFIKAVQTTSLESVFQSLYAKYEGKTISKKVIDNIVKDTKECEELKRSEFADIFGLGGWEVLKKNMETVQEIDNKIPPTEEIQQKYQDLGYCDVTVSNRTPEDWYCLLRNIQGIITFAEIYKGNLHHISNAKDFFKESLHCEYGYLINLDTMKFEAYEGFQSDAPQPGNRFGEEKNKSGYYPCKMVGEFPLDKIPDNWIEKCFKEEED